MNDIKEMIRESVTRIIGLIVVLIISSYLLCVGRIEIKDWFFVCMVIVSYFTGEYNGRKHK